MTLALIITSPELLGNERLRINDITLVVSESQHRFDRICREILLPDTERDILSTAFWGDIDISDLSIQRGQLKSR